jgi:FkbM family methyltransferase
LNGEFALISKIIKKGDVVFDVGANVGEWSYTSLMVAGTLKLYCFEPVEETFLQLTKNLGQTGAMLNNVAIADSNGTKIFNYYNKNPKLARMSTFYRRSEALEQRLEMQPKKIEVRVQTLDSFCKDNPILRIDYLKIDTEGSELDVLRGAEGILSRGVVRKLQFEYGGNFKEADITIKQVCELLTKYGFSLFRIIPDGLLHISRWRDSLENYTYSNFLAVCSEQAGVYEPMKGLSQPAEINERGNNSGSAAVIFSKDRAIQLAATIDSFKLHCTDSENVRLSVLYKTSSQYHQDQYDKLIAEYDDVQFVKEVNFKQQLLSIVNSGEHILFMVDDNIFVKDFYLGDVLESLRQNESAVGFSLRIGTNTQYSYARNMQVALPDFERIAADILRFNWTTSQSHFGYPLEVSSSVYRSRDIIPLLNAIDFSNPNILEGLIEANKHFYAQSNDRLLCFETSVTFCNPVNIVQTVCDNRAGSNNLYAADELAKKFDDGLRIDVPQYSGFVPNSCHQEVELKFRKAKATQDSNTPLVSVEMVTYNAEKYLRRAIGSILAQTYRNFELLIVDDGSTDNTRQIVESFSDSRIRYLYKVHKNRWAGTNYAIAHAKGKYILAVDSDDSIATDYIEKMIRFAQQHPEVDYFYPRVLTIVDGAGELTGSKWEYIDFSNNRILPNYLFEMLLSPIPYPGSLRRMSMFERTGGYEELENVADFVFLCKNALKINFKRVDEQSVYFYRSTGSSLSHRLRIRNQTMANTLNDMVRIYPPEVLCPQLASVDEPALKQQRFYKYLMTVFYRHIDGHMVQFGEYFKKYGDFYKSKLLECASRVNRAASAVSSPPAPEDAADLFEQGIKYLKRYRPNDALTCFNKVLRTVGQMPDLHYARAVALLQSGRIYDAQLACHAELDLRKDHQGAKKLLDRISRSREACKIG